MVAHEQDSPQVIRMGWFVAGAMFAIAVMAAYFFAGDYLFGGADVKADAPQQIIEGQ
jgi:hypothetical protein